MRWILSAISASIQQTKSNLGMSTVLAEDWDVFEYESKQSSAVSLSGCCGLVGVDNR
jgi:hypothetical protein